MDAGKVQDAFTVLGEVVNVIGRECAEDDAESRRMALYALMTRTLLAEILTGMADGKSFAETIVTAKCYRKPAEMAETVIVH